MRRVLVVCTANQCRSPMAEALVRQHAQASGVADRVSVSSAGTWAEEGVEATRHAATVMLERGIVLEGHRSREVDAPMLADADLVLVMTQGHREAIATEFPEARDKTHLMSWLAGATYDIADPIGGSEDDYRVTAAELERLIDKGWPLIVGSV